MGFWSTLGHGLLTAAPYIAAPFTGGASLAFAPLTSGINRAWSQSEANKRAAQGLGPSNVNNIISMAGDFAGMAGGAGAFGRGEGGSSGMFGAGNFGRSTPTSGWQGALAGAGRNVLDRFGGQGQGNYYNSQGGGQQMTRGSDYDPTSRVGMNTGTGRGLGPSNDSGSPNLALSINAGRREAIGNQPFRSGYPIRTQGPDDSVITSRNPPIFSSLGGGRNRTKQRAS